MEGDTGHVSGYKHFKENVNYAPSIHLFSFRSCLPSSDPPVPSPLGSVPSLLFSCTPLPPLWPSTSGFRPLWNLHIWCPITLKPAHLASHYFDCAHLALKPLWNLPIWCPITLKPAHLALKPLWNLHTQCHTTLAVHTWTLHRLKEWRCHQG